MLKGNTKMASKKIASKTPGLRYKFHPSRRHGINFDKYFSIRYRIDGRLKEEGLGWSSEGWTEKKAGAALFPWQREKPFLTRCGNTRRRPIRFRC
mgnify:CR=1 FL=1